MLYRRYGKTNLKVSVFTFGAMRFTFDEGKLTPLECAERERNAVAVMRRAAELGINHVDTARGYGNSERLVGLGLKELGRTRFHVTTKIQIQPSRDEALRQVEQALKKLQVERIDILDLHGINTMDRLKMVIAKDGCLAGVQEAMDQGLVGYAGFSSHGEPDVILRAMETRLFSAVSLHYWWTHPRNSAVVRRAGELDVGVLIISPAEKGGMLFKPTPETIRVCDPFSPLVLTHRWLLAQKPVTTLSIGAARPSDFDAHLPALNGNIDELSRDEQAALGRWTKAEQDTLGATRCTICYKCMPCPRHVAIPEILRLRNLTRTFDMAEFAQMRYNLLGQGDHWFPGEKADHCNQCGECLPLCPDRLKIPELLADTHQLLAGPERQRLWNEPA